MYPSDFWIDYRFADDTDGRRRWIDTYEDFLGDLAELRRDGCRIVAFGYHTVPPPLPQVAEGKLAQDGAEWPARASASSPYY